MGKELALYVGLGLSAAILIIGSRGNRAAGSELKL
jgi:hypothetical protein